VLGAGEFNWDDTRLTAAALALFVFSLLAQNLTTLFVRSYYAQGKTKTPLLMNLLSAVFIVLSSFVLVKFFEANLFFRSFIESILKVSDTPGTIVLMLPLGFTLGSIINLLIYWVAFNRQFKNFSSSVSRTFFDVFSASVIMGFVTYSFLAVFDSVFNINTLIGIFMQGLLSGVVGIISAVITLFLLKNKELQEVWITLHKKIWGAKVIVPDPELN
jgi:peptidoglycan biosynthesis protein MviN/MurJ (putative lipid II flippase)